MIPKFKKIPKLSIQNRRRLTDPESSIYLMNRNAHSLSPKPSEKSKSVCSMLLRNIDAAELILVIFSLIISFFALNIFVSTFYSNWFEVFVCGDFSGFLSGSSDGLQIVECHFEYW